VKKSSFGSNDTRGVAASARRIGIETSIWNRASLATFACR